MKHVMPDLENLGTTPGSVAHDALQDAIYQAKETLLSMGVWK